MYPTQMQGASSSWLNKSDQLTVSPGRLNLQNGKGSAANDANAKDQEGKTDTLNGGDKGNGLDSVLFADEETWNRDGEASYEASVWAKVAIADMTTRSIAHREDSGGKGKERDGNGRKGQSSSRKSKKEKRGKRAQQDDRIGEKERRRSGCVALQEVCHRSCMGARRRQTARIEN